MRRQWKRHRIRQVDIDFLCLSVFGQRALPDDMAARIAARREFYENVKDPLGRVADTGSVEPASLEAVGV